MNVDANSFIPGTTVRPLNLQSALQYPNAFAYASADKSLGSSNYEGLLASITKRVGGSALGETFFTVGYTYSKTLSDQDAFLTRFAGFSKNLRECCGKPLKRKVWVITRMNTRTSTLLRFGDDGKKIESG